MKEFNFPYNEGLHVGLLPNDRFRRNIPGLLECYNMKVDESGLVPYVAIIDPLTGAPTYSWPYPQLFDTTIGIFAASETGIYEADSGYNLTAKITSLPVGDIWHMADFYDYQVWVNGATCVVRDTTTGVFSVETLTHIVESVCNYKGQLIAGGFGGDKGNWVAWSGIGKTYLTELLDKEDQTNITGQMPVGWFGDVYCVKRLGEYVMVYGSGGVSALRPISSPVTGFGLRVMLQHGIAGKGCIGGDKHRHIFVDTEGYLWSATENIEFRTVELKKLGYKNFMTNLGAADIVINYDKLEKEFYISDGVRTYLLSTGLSEIYQLPSGIVRVGSGLYGALHEAVDADTSAFFTTNSFDMNLRAIKMISVLEIGCTGSGMQAGVDYCYNTLGSYTRSTLKDVNAKGVVSPVVSGVDFKVHVTAPLFSAFEVDSLLIRWKLNDKTAIRGTYGNQGNM